VFGKNKKELSKKKKDGVHKLKGPKNHPYEARVENGEKRLRFKAGHRQAQIRGKEGAWGAKPA